MLAASSALGLAATGARAALLPADPVFGRTLIDLDGRSVALADYRGRPLLLNFWASWCAPCVREMPLLESLHHKYADVALLGLAIDSKDNVLRFLEKVEVSYPILLTGNQGIPLMRELGNRRAALPYTALFDRKGRDAGRVLGELEGDEIEARMRKLR